MLNNKFTFINLTLENTTFYKGVAILMIAIHNFFHLLPPKFGENEQDFDFLRIETYIQLIFNQPELFFQATFSFLGHYGVQIFVFLSAYGLTKKYFNSKIIYMDFLKKRIFKIYPAFLLSIVIWAIYIGFNDGGPINVILERWKLVLTKLILISNFIPGHLYKLNGPWWFVSLIVQFYIIFPLIMYIYKRYGNLGLINISLASLLLTAYFQPMVSIQLPGTVLTHIPEICIGIFLAQQQKFTINYFTILVITIIFILSNIYHFFWFLSYSSSLILLLIIFQNLLLKSNQVVTRIVFFVGSISMYIFYINGFLRDPWIGFAINYNLWYINIFICFIFIAISISASFLMMHLLNTISKIFNKISLLIK